MDNNKNKKSNKNISKNKTEKKDDKRVQKSRSITKADLKKRNDKAKYSDEEIERAKYIDSKAKFITRDRVSNDVIDTSKKWVGVNNVKGEIKTDRYGNEIYDIQEMDVETFDKKDIPAYTEDMTEQEKHELTYDTAEGDISKQRKRGTKGPEYRVKTHTEKKGRKSEIVIDDVTRIDTVKDSLKKSNYRVSKIEKEEIVDIYCSSRSKNEYRRKLLDAGYDESFVEEQVKKFSNKK